MFHSPYYIIKSYLSVEIPVMATELRGAFLAAQSAGRHEIPFEVGGFAAAASKAGRSSGGAPRISPSVRGV